MPHTLPLGHCPLLHPLALSLLSQALPQTLTILLLISWKWISHTFSTMSSLSNVTNPKPEEKAKLLDQVRARRSSHPLPTSFYWQEKRRRHRLLGRYNQPFLKRLSFIFPLQQSLLLCTRTGASPYRFPFPPHPVLPTLSEPNCSQNEIYFFKTLLSARQTTWLTTLGRIPADSRSHKESRWRNEQLLASPSPSWLNAPHQQ